MMVESVFFSLVGEVFVDSGIGGREGVHDTYERESEFSLLLSC